MPRTDPDRPGPSPARAPAASPSARSARSPTPAALLEILDEARAAGYLGPGPLETQLRHAEGFAVVARRLWPDGPTPPVLLDLGSGGGLPGLVVAIRWPEAMVVLLDSSGRRTAFLGDAVRRLGLAPRVAVRQDRAEVAGRDPGLRGEVDIVLARSFGRPAVVAECAAPLLRLGGWLVVSEPPAAEAGVPAATLTDSPGAPRWPAEPLRQLGLEPARLEHEEFEYQTLVQAEPCPERFPRRDGIPAKRPLF